MKNFWSTFLACLLALVVANVVIGVFLVMVLAGIGTLFSETVPDVQQKTVLRLDFAEPISDDPSRNPLSEMGFNDLISMRVARNYALIDVLKAIETAATDDRISGIYLNVSPNMGMGMATLEEIREAVETVYHTGNRQLVLLKCSSAYPADPAQMYLRTITDMQKRFDLPIGLSDHSMGSMSAVTAVALGASVIEKHFCLSREIENPDASFSMTPEEYKQMVQDIRNVEAALGTPTYGVEKQEESSRVFRRSIFAVKDIPAGAELTEENIRIIRPGYGIKPKYWKDVLGMRTDHAMERGTPITFDALEKGSILFLTNNTNTDGLYRWLKEQGEQVYRVENKVTAQMIAQMKPSLMISFNYRHMIPQEVLELMPGRVINLHTSYLPYNRGSSPNFFSFLEDTPKGVTIHLMSAGLDEGDILCQRELHFDEEKETFASTYEALLQEIEKLFRENWQQIREGSIIPVKQAGPVTYHRMKDLDAIREKVDFDWNMKIGDFKRAYEKAMRKDENS